MSTAAPETLDRRAVPWLFATALATILPHLTDQPPWLLAMAGLMLAWGVWLWWRGRRLPNGWLLGLLVATGCAGVLLEFRTLFGRDAGVAMLFLFMAMKLLELRSLRDAYVVVNLGYFLLLTHYFHSQGIATGLWLLGTLTVVTATLVRLHGGPASTTRMSLRYAGLLMVQAIPFFLVLYILFPRISGPLWGLPQDAHSARSGLADRVSPGTIANLAQSADIAFRVRFDGPAPNQDRLYWRGPVMEDYDGSAWTRHQAFGQPPGIRPLGATLSYELTLEPHDQRWLLALDAPTALPPETSLTASLSAVTRSPVTQRQRLVFTSTLDYRFNLQENPSVLERNTRLPRERNPRTLALAREWRQSDPSPEHLVQRALALFQGQDFQYTLRSPLLGRNPVDEFLFDTRKGFCEHYASAFAVLMRAAGIPARVVGGYQGGEVNPVDGYFVVRQSDAHAWTEVWLPGKGWIRMDPTAAVSPARVESGLAASVSANDSLPAFIRPDARWLRALRYRWEATNNAWNQWVLGYNPQRQRELFSRLGLPDPDWRTLGPLLAAACAGLVLAFTAWTLYQRPRLDPAQRLWRQALRRLERLKVRPQPWEAPLALASRVRKEHPELAPALEAIVDAYCRARYSAGPADLRTLRVAVARLP